MRSRVAITGLGCVLPHAATAPSLWLAAMRGESSIRPLTRFPCPSVKPRCAAELPADWVERHFPPHERKRIDRFTALAIAATQQAITDAGWTNAATTFAPPPEDWGVSLGTALGGLADAESHLARFLQQGTATVPASLATQVYGGSAQGHLCQRWGWAGYSLTNTNSCAAGTVAIGEAMRALRERRARVMIAVGAESPITPLVWAAFDQLGAMSHESDPARAQRPFDRNRDGFIMAEGAAALVLEDWDLAHERGANIYAEVLGYGLTCDAFHMVSSLPDGSGAARAMHLALRDAEVDLHQIAAVYTHGSGTPMNERNEEVALRSVWGDSLPRLIATKGLHGHSLGAVGAVETLLAAKALREGCLPPSIHCDHPEPGVANALVRQPEPCSPNAIIMKNSFGFGGINASLILRSTSGF